MKRPKITLKEFIILGKLDVERLDLLMAEKTLCTINNPDDLISTPEGEQFCDSFLVDGFMAKANDHFAIWLKRKEEDNVQNSDKP